MTTDNKKILLVPSLPEELEFDVVFHSARGVGVRVSDEEIQALTVAGIAHVELYASENEYASAMENMNRSQAIAALESTQDTRLASLDPVDRDQFGIA